MRVLIVAEYYPRAHDPVRGVWAHRQAVAARDAGAEVRVLVLHRPIPPRAAIAGRNARAALDELRQPARTTLDGIEVDYLRYLSPPRPLSYAHWGAFAAPALRRRLNAIAAADPYDLIHAHYAIPAGDAVRRAAPQAPLVVSVHGHDVFGSGPGANHRHVDTTLAHARLTIANSAGTAARCAARGARRTEVVHLGTDLPSEPAPPPTTPTLVTVAHLAARKRHADVLDAIALLTPTHPDLRYVIVGDGPERAALEARTRQHDLQNRVTFTGALPPDDARARAQNASLFVMPSVDEAFGVAYIEAMAGGVPAIGCATEPGPLELAAAGPGGILLVPPHDPRTLAETIAAALTDGHLRSAARRTVETAFTWAHTGTQTVTAYRSVR